MSSSIKVYAIALPIYRYIWQLFIIHVCMYYIWMCIIPVAGSYSDSNLPILFKTFSTPILFAHKPSNSEPMQSPNTAPTKAPLNFERRTFFDMFVLLSFYTISDVSVTILNLVSLYNLPVLYIFNFRHASLWNLRRRGLWRNWWFLLLHNVSNTISGELYTRLTLDLGNILFKCLELHNANQCLIFHILSFFLLPET